MERTAIPSGAVLQRKWRIRRINAVRGDTGVRIGIIATKTCVNCDYNSMLGFGAKDCRDAAMPMMLNAMKL